MSENRRVTDDEILSGFASLQEIVLAGFARMVDGFATIDERFATLEQSLRRDISNSEHRMLRRFDAVDKQLADIDRRVARLESPGG